VSFGHQWRRPLRSERIEFRVTPDEKEVIEAAAHLSGQRVSDFAVPLVVQAARQALEKQGHTVLCAADWQSLVEVLQAIPEPSLAAQQTLQRLQGGRRVTGDGNDVYILGNDTSGDEDASDS